MSIRVNNIKISLKDDIGIVKDKAAKTAKINISDMDNFKILKESIDARKKDNIYFVYNVEFDCENENRVVQRAKNNDVILSENYNNKKLQFGTLSLKHRPVIIGSGPAGLFAGLILAKNGYNPIIFERGGSVEERTEKINKFWSTGELDTDSNIQFGEGGAGTFSDGKLTTRIKDPRCDFVLEEFVNAGAPAEIAFSGKPHIGTDILKGVVKTLRKSIESYGGEIRFNSKMTDITIKNGKLESVQINNEYDVPCETAIIALGHSARDTYEMLFSRGVKFEQKPFAIGVRIEHLQEMIDTNQYGEFAKHPKLRAADYRLAYTSDRFKRPCYSFCMCPGGIVVAAASERERLVTNGMSEYKRDKDNANSAIVVGVGHEDYKSNHPLAGVEFQRYYENMAFIAGGGDYKAPVQLVGDFLKDEISKKIGGVVPSYSRGYTFSDMRNCLPEYVINVLKEGLVMFDKKIKGFASYDAILTGIETRTSSPVRIERNEELQCISIEGLYPAGEGAGYAGGIVSAAVDGIRVAEGIMTSFKPF